MARINVLHVGVAGVIAGFIVNATAQAAWNYVLPNRHLAGSYLWGFAVGIITVSFYASLSARSGPSPARALMAGTIVWLFTLAAPNYAYWTLQVFNGHFMAMSSALGLVEVIPAALVGAWAYDWAATARQARAQEQRSRSALSVRLTPHTPLTVKAI